MAGNGYVSDGDKENQSTSSQDVTSRYNLTLCLHLAPQVSPALLWSSTYVEIAKTDGVIIKAMNYSEWTVFPAKVVIIPKKVLLDPINT